MKLTRLVCRVSGLILLALGAVNPANAGTPGKCQEPPPPCDKRNICGSIHSACKVRVSETGTTATATPQNLPSGNVWKPGDAICVKPGTEMQWFTEEADSEFKATFGVPHPFSHTPTSAAIFQGMDGQTVSDKAILSSCYQYSLEHLVQGHPKATDDPKVIVTDIGDMVDKK